jgi:hypothetical protein
VRNALSAHVGGLGSSGSESARKKNATPALRNMSASRSIVPSVTVVTSMVSDVIDGGDPVSRARQ